MRVEITQHVGADSGTTNPQSLVMSQEECQQLAQLLLDIAKPSPFMWPISVIHTVQSITGVSQGETIDIDDGDRISVELSPGGFGHYASVAPTTNQRDAEVLRKIIAKVFAMRAPTPPIPSDPVDADDPLYLMYDKRSYVPVSLWHESTATAMGTARSDVIAKVIRQVEEAQLLGTATIGFAARSELFMHPLGRLAYGKETDCEVTVTARTPDNKASGWGGHASRDWSRVHPEAVAAQAIDMANRSRNRVALEPGRRTAILGPAAVAQLVRAMTELFFYDNAVTGRSPFWIGHRTTKPPMTKLGQRVFDPRIMMTSDPNDPEGGYMPFFEYNGERGFPTPATTWIDHGVLKYLSCGIGTAMRTGQTPRDDPFSMRLEAAPGTKTSTIEEMIANCAEGVYVHRFSGVDMVDARSGLMTGVTRDGCFFIQHGKITKAIKNFRFLDSPIFALNKLAMIGTPERVAFGYRNYGRYETRFPRSPIIVPPLMVQDFNFSALADAV